MEPNYNPFHNASNEHENTDVLEHTDKQEPSHIANNDNTDKSNHTFDNNFNPYTFQTNGYATAPPRKKRGNSFETASLALGIGAILSCTLFYGAYIMGAFTNPNR